MLAEEAGDRIGLTNILHGTGDVPLARGNVEQAETAYRRSLRLCIEVGLVNGPQYCLAGLAASAATTGNATRAGTLWGATTKLETETTLALLPHERSRYEKLVGPLEASGSPAFAAAVARGRSMTTDEMYAYALGDR